MTILKGPVQLLGKHAVGKRDGEFKILYNASPIFNIERSYFLLVFQLSQEQALIN